MNPTSNLCIPIAVGPVPIHATVPVLLPPATFRTSIATILLNPPIIDGGPKGPNPNPNHAPEKHSKFLILTLTLPLPLALALINYHIA